MSWWYAKVDFDPIKIYTMGAGNAAMAAKVKNNEALKNNPAAIPVLNKNYLWADYSGFVFDTDPFSSNTNATLVNYSSLTTCP